jgi:hypothetical protein
MNWFLNIFLLAIIICSIYSTYTAWFGDWPEKRYEIDLHSPLMFHSLVESVGKKGYIKTTEKE